MRDDFLDARQRAALSALSKAREHEFYLAGGTGLALHLGHRKSIDLDLFRTEPFDAEAMVHELRVEGVPLTDVTTSRSTVHARVEETRTSLLSFPYPLLEPAQPAPSGLPVASVADIAAMKVEAIASRGAKKDFYDLFFICKSGMPFGRTLEAFRTRFASANPDLYHRLRALIYFEDAEQEPEPLLIRPATWKDVKRFFESEVSAVWAAAAPEPPRG